MATPPTRVSSAASANSTAAGGYGSVTTPKTVSITGTLNGDLLLCKLAGGDGQLTFTGPSTTAGTTGTWTTPLNIGTSGSSARVILSWANVTANGDITVSFTRVAGPQVWGFELVAYRNHGGVGSNVGSREVLNPATGTMDCTFTTTNDNSALEVVGVDWSANSVMPTTTDEREAQAGNETSTVLYGGDGSNYGVMGGYYADAGTAGSKTVGWSLTRQPTIGAFEIIGTAGAPAVGNRLRRWQY